MQLTKRSSTNTPIHSSFNFEITRDQTQTMSFLVGALLITIATSEIVIPHFVEMNLSLFHAVLIASMGGSLIYNGLKDHSRFAYLTCLSAGLFFAIFSAFGFLFGEPRNAYVRYDAIDSFVLELPGFNSLGSFDHGFHAVLAVVLLIGALDWYRHHRDDVADSSAEKKSRANGPTSWGRE